MTDTFRSKVEIVAEDIGASLRFATVDTHKVIRPQAEDETEEAPQAILTILRARISTAPGIEPGHCCVPTRFGEDLSRGLTSSAVGHSRWFRELTSGPGIERGAQAGIEPATGACWTGTDRLRQSGTGDVHTPAPFGANAAYSTGCDLLGESRPTV